MLRDRERCIRAVQSVLDTNPHMSNGELAERGVDTISALPFDISNRELDIALEAYDPRGITQNRRDRMRLALQAVFTTQVR